MAGQPAAALNRTIGKFYPPVNLTIAVEENQMAGGVLTSEGQTGGLHLAENLMILRSQNSMAGNLDPSENLSLPIAENHKVGVHPVAERLMTGRLHLGESLTLPL